MSDAHDIERAAEDAAGCSHHRHGDHDLFSPTNEGDAELVHRLKEDEADRATSIALLRAARRRSLDAEQLLTELPTFTAGAAAAADAPHLEPVDEDGPADATATVSRTSDSEAAEDALAAAPASAHGAAAKPPLAPASTSPGRTTFASGSPSSASKKVSAAAAAAAAGAGVGAGPAGSVPMSSSGAAGGAGGPAGGGIFSTVSIGSAALAAALEPAAPRTVVFVPSTTVSVSGILTVEEADVRSPQAFQRVAITGPAVLNAEQKQAARLLLKALAMREKHLYKKVRPNSQCKGPQCQCSRPADPRREAKAGTWRRRGSAFSAGGTAAVAGWW